MTVISFINPKGGTGKTTSAILIAEQAALAENTTLILDCDPNNNIDYWYQEREQRGDKTPFTVAKGPSALDLIDIVEEYEKENDLVILDMEGSADQIVTFAIAISDLTIIPFKPSPMEARQCARAIHLVKQSARLGSSNGEFRLLVNRSNAAIRTKEETILRKELGEAGLDKKLLSSRLVDRAAYMRIFRDHKLLYELSVEEDANIGKATANAQDVFLEILKVLKEIAHVTRI